MKEISLKIEGMHCTGCSNRLEKVLNNVDGVVLGTSLLFNKNNDYVKCINNLKEKENV